MGEKINNSGIYSTPNRSMRSSASKSSKKKRNSNFSHDEIKCLITEFGNRSNLLNFGTRDQKQRCWEEITEQININHPDFNRSVTEIKKKWIDLLYDTKKQYIKASTEAEKDGNSKRRKLSAIAEMIVKVKGGFADKYKAANSLKVINFQVADPVEDEENVQTTTFFIPGIEDCQSSDSLDNSGNVPQDNLDEFVEIKQTTSDSMMDSIEQYESYSDMIPESSNNCSCGMTADFLRLKQEEIGLAKRVVQIEEERRLEEKQKWWETKALIRLQKQKLELEIKALRQSLPQSCSDI